MDRQEHLEWAKKRAAEYLDDGDPAQAYASFVSDCRKHPDLNYNSFLFAMGLNPIYQTSVPKMREFINGFN